MTSALRTRIQSKVAHSYKFSEIYRISYYFQLIDWFMS